MTTIDNVSATKARNGVWTPWAQVLCVECDYLGLKDSPRAPHYDKHLKAVAAMNRTEEVPQPEGDQLGACNTCHCTCWVRKDVALIQQVGFKAAELDWEGPFGWALEQTGGWDAFGMRGTCSNSYLLRAAGHVDQVIADPYAEISPHTMVPVAHLTWSAVWTGIAASAVERARQFVRKAMRGNTGQLPRRRNTRRPFGSANRSGSHAGSKPSAGSRAYTHCSTASPCSSVVYEPRSIASASPPGARWTKPM